MWDNIKMYTSWFSQWTEISWNQSLPGRREISLKMYVFVWRHEVLYVNRLTFAKPPVRSINVSHTDIAHKFRYKWLTGRKHIFSCFSYFWFDHSTINVSVAKALTAKNIQPDSLWKDILCLRGTSVVLSAVKCASMHRWIVL